uniref:Uncharacterized protein n=1 Tax=Arundo donax TaxID=35708 RepID=A0A0A8ZC15_ARUDO
MFHSEILDRSIKNLHRTKTCERF